MSLPYIFPFRKVFFASFFFKRKKYSSSLLLIRRGVETPAGTFIFDAEKDLPVLFAVHKRLQREINRVARLFCDFKG